MDTVELLVHCLDVENVFNLLAPSFYYLIFSIFMLLSLLYVLCRGLQVIKKMKTPLNQ